ncbi:hypothetical protein ABZ234_00200 [Nocardiopsis sp. NPDC006198]|uniref:hypothetical protein n=1 Tax=Nocardiopsis sp. NPDC006198 TaxID=3154472 RepID=UPI0033B3A172
MNPSLAPQSATTHTCITYLGAATWVVDGQHCDWAASYRHLTRERGMGRAETNVALVQAYQAGQGLGDDHA